MQAKQLVTGSVVVLFATTAYGGGIALRCQLGKNQAVGRYAACRLKAEGKLALIGDMSRYSASLLNCENKYASTWPALEQKALEAGDPCPSSMDQTSIKQFTDACSDTIATALGGDEVFTAANLTAENIKSGQTILGITGTYLATLPGSGQTTAYGAGSDGDVQAGMPLSYTDNGDGTITDNVTGLMWEKKDDSGGIHDQDNRYTWSGASFGTSNIMDGTISTEFLAALNAGAGFAGHRDWRIPNYKELMSILNLEMAPPSRIVDAAFHQAATCSGCVDVTAATCSCTAFDLYWAATTYAPYPSRAWLVSFDSGYVIATEKDFDVSVRAVRGGL